MTMAIGFVGIHAALDANYKWPEYAEMLGGWFDGHPWNTFDAPIVVEDSNFPATRHFAREFMARDLSGQELDARQGERVDAAGRHQAGLHRKEQRPPGS